MRTLVMLGLLLTGCAAIPVVPAAPPTPEPVVVLVRAETRGGLCAAETTCGSTITVMSDGSRTSTVNDAEHTGTLPAGRIAALADAVERTGLAVAPPFTGTCPVACDGPEQVLSWLDDGGLVSVGSCEREFDPADPLVRAAARLTEELA